MLTPLKIFDCQARIWQISIFITSLPSNNKPSRYHSQASVVQAPFIWEQGLFCASPTIDFLLPWPKKPEINSEASKSEDFACFDFAI